MTLSTFNFPNGIDDFQPILLNDLTVVNADHVNDLREAIVEIENALVGITSIPYSGTNIVQATDNIKRAIEKLDANVTFLLNEIDSMGDGYDGYDTRIDRIENQLEAHRSSQGPIDAEGYGVHGVDGQVVGTNNEQVLTNKKVDSGVGAHVGPKFIARASPADAGLRQIEVYDTLGTLSAWIDEQGNAFFNGDVTILGDEIVQDIQVVQSHLVVDGYTILGNPSQMWTHEINGDLTVNNTNTLFNADTFTHNGTNTNLGNSTGTLNLDYVQTNLDGNLTVTGMLMVEGITTLGDSGDPLTINGSVYIDSTLQVQGETTLYGNVLIGNSTSLDTLTIQVATLDITVGSGELNINADLNVSGSIESLGTTYIFGEASTATTNTLLINAITTINGPLDIVGATPDVQIGGSLAAAGDTTLGGLLTVSDNVDLQSTGTFNVEAANSTFAGNGTFDEDLIVAGTTTFGTVLGDTHQVNGNAFFAGNVDVTADVIIGGGFQNTTYPAAGGMTLFANGDLSMDGKLTVKGPIDPIALIIEADLSQEPLPFLINNGTSIFQIDGSGNTYAPMGSLHYGQGIYIGPASSIFKATAASTTIGPASDLDAKPTLVVRATTVDFRNAGQMWLRGDVEIGSTTANDLLIRSDTLIQGTLIVNGTINGVNLSNINQALNDHFLGIPYPSHEATHIRFQNNTTNIGERPLRDALEIVAGAGWDHTAHDSLFAHLMSTTAHAAQNITFSSANFPLVTETREAILELAGSGWTLGVDDSLKEHLDSSIAHDADEVVYAPVPNSILSEINVQDALEHASVLLDDFLVVKAQSTARTNLAPRADDPTSKSVIIAAAPGGVFVHAQTRTLLPTDQTVSFAAAPATGYSALTPYRRAAIAFRANGTFAITYSAFAANVGSLVDPFWEAGTIPVAVVNLFFNSSTPGDISNISASAIVDVRPLPTGTTGGPIVVTSIDTPTAQAFPIAASMGANTLTLGAGTSTVLVPGALEIQGITGGTLFQASTGYDVDVLNNPLGLAVSAGNITLGQASSLTTAPGDITVQGTIRTNDLNILISGDDLTIGSGVDAGTITIGNGLSTAYIPGNVITDGYIALGGALGIVDVTSPKSMFIGASVGGNTINIGAATTTTAYAGVVKVNQTTASTSTTTGALTVAGGVGISGNLNVGGTFGITGTVTFSGAQQVKYGNTVTANYVVGADDYLIPVDTTSAVSNIVITLPTISAANRGRLIIVKDIGGATSQLNKAIVIQGNGGNTIDGAATVTIDSSLFALTFVADGVGNWSII